MARIEIATIVLGSGKQFCFVLIFLLFQLILPAHAQFKRNNTADNLEKERIRIYGLRTPENDSVNDLTRMGLYGKVHFMTIKEPIINRGVNELNFDTITDGGGDHGYDPNKDVTIAEQYEWIYFVFSRSGNLIRREETGGYATDETSSYFYDKLDRLLRIVRQKNATDERRAELQIDSYYYANNGKLILVQSFDNNGQIPEYKTIFRYDINQRIVQEEHLKRNYCGTGTEGKYLLYRKSLFSYDAKGKIASEVDSEFNSGCSAVLRNGWNSWKYSTDNKGTEISSNGGTKYTLMYDENGYCVEFSDYHASRPLGTHVNIKYNEYGDVVRMNESIHGEPHLDRIYKYVYDVHGNPVKEETYAEGDLQPCKLRMISYEYY